jgi:CBS domain-containing protein
MIVERIMTRDVACCRSSDTLEEAARLMSDRDCGCLAVLAADDSLIGVVTDRDICLAAYNQHAPLSGILVDHAMSRHVRVCGPRDELSEVAQRMQLFKVRRLPVVDADRRVIGLVSIDDIAIAADRGRDKPGYPSAASVTHTLASLAGQPVAIEAE